MCPIFGCQIISPLRPPPGTSAWHLLAAAVARALARGSGPDGRVPTAVVPATAWLWRRSGVDRGRRGPGVGGCELGKSIDSSQFRGSVPMPTRQSVHCARRPPRSLDLAAAEGSHQARRQTDDALKSSWYQANVERAGALSPMMDGSNSSLQARSPCITAAVLCLPAAISAHMMPSAPKLAHASMHS